MSLQHTGNLTLADISPELAKAFKLLSLLNAQLDAALFGSLSVSLGTLQAEVSAQLQAAIQASINIGLNLANPFIGFQLALAACVALVAQIQAALAGGLVIGLSVSAQLSAQASLVASLEIKLGLLNLQIQAMLALKAQISIPDLTPGPISMYWWEPSGNTTNLTAAGSAILQEFADPANASGISPFAPSYGILLVTQVPAAWTLLKKFFKTT